MSIEERNEIGSRLKEAREYLNISQEEAAKWIGIARSAISLIESGSRKLETTELSSLAKLYQKPASYFIDGKSQGLESDDIKALARSYSGLSDEDKTELLQFSEFLSMRSKKGL